MADYPISIDAVRKMLIDLRSSLGNERYISIGLSMALHQLDGFPQMDAVPVVRCRECVFRSCADLCPMCWYVSTMDVMRVIDITEDDGFCHRGGKLDAKDMDVSTKDGGAE